MKSAYHVLILLLFLLTSCTTPEQAPPEKIQTDSTVIPEKKAENSESLCSKPTPPTAEKAEEEEEDKTGNEIDTAQEVTDPRRLSESVPQAAPPPGQPAETVQTENCRNRIPSTPASLYLSRLENYPSLESERTLSFRVFPEDAVIQKAEEGKLVGLNAVSRENDRTFYLSDAGAVILSAPGYIPRIISLSRESDTIEVKLERVSGPLIRAGGIRTDYQPKSVRFTPDGKSIFVANLGDYTALTRFSTSPLALVQRFEVPEEFRKDSGFVETLILPGRNEIWLSQMNGNIIHVFNIDSGEYITGIRLSGIWPKVLTSNPEESRVYASCWESETVVEIDAELKCELRSFRTSGTPRGLVLSPDGKKLFAAIFSSSGVDCIDLESGRLLTTYEASPGRNTAMRHIVYDRSRREYYVTAMGAGRVYRLSECGQWLGYWDVGDKPNTCALSPDGSRLFVSCRGPNNPDTGYLHKGYEFGKIYVINLRSGSVEDWIWGMDQPTGLDVSPDGKYLAFSDFLSHRLELYHITGDSHPGAGGGR